MKQASQPWPAAGSKVAVGTDRKQGRGAGMGLAPGYTPSFVVLGWEWRGRNLRLTLRLLLF